MSDSLYFGLGALVFASCAAFGIKVGRFKTQVYKQNPYLRRSEEPGLFWFYAIAQFLAAALLAYVAIDSAR